MRVATKPNEKFQKARQYLRERFEIAAKLPNWRYMQRRTLYKALELVGVVWDKHQRVWYMGRLQDTTPSVTVKAPRRTTDSTKDVVLVRIITDKGNIEQVTAELIELSEAVDLELVKRSEAYNSKYGDSQHVYLTFRIRKESGQ